MRCALLVALAFSAGGALSAQVSPKPVEADHWAFDLVEALATLDPYSLPVFFVQPVSARRLHEAMSSRLTNGRNTAWSEGLGTWLDRFEGEMGIGRGRPGRLGLRAGYDGDSASVFPRRDLFVGAVADYRVMEGIHLWADVEAAQSGESTRLRSGGASAEVGSLHVLVGRIPLGVGQGLDRMLVNGRSPVDGAFVGLDEPILLPGPLRFLGPFTLFAFVAPRVDFTEVPDTWFSSFGFSFAPHPRVHLGAFRGVRFAGEGKTPTTFSNLVDMVLGGGENFDYDDSQGELAVRVFWEILGRPITSHLSIGFEDSSGFHQDPGLLVGTMVPLVVRDRLLTLRYEYEAFGERAMWCGPCEFVHHGWYDSPSYGAYEADGVPVGSLLGGYGAAHRLAVELWTAGLPLRVKAVVFREDRDFGNLLWDRWPGKRSGLTLALRGRPFPWGEVHAGLGLARNEDRTESRISLSLSVFDVLSALDFRSASIR